MMSLTLDVGKPIPTNDPEHAQIRIRISRTHALKVIAELASELEDCLDCGGVEVEIFLNGALRDS